MLQQLLEMLLHKVLHLHQEVHELATFYKLSGDVRGGGPKGVNLRFRTCGQKRLPCANVKAGTAAGKVDQLQAPIWEISAILHLPFHIHTCLPIAQWVQNC
jgi:hypothetical protein